MEWNGFPTNSGAVYNDKYNNSMYTRRGILIKLASGLVSNSFNQYFKICDIFPWFN